MIGKQVIYEGEIHTIIFDYQNGMVEIKSLDASFNGVKLVNVREISILEG